MKHDRILLTPQGDKLRVRVNLPNMRGNYCTVTLSVWRDAWVEVVSLLPNNMPCRKIRWDQQGVTCKDFDETCELLLSKAAAVLTDPNLGEPDE